MSTFGFDEPSEGKGDLPLPTSIPSAAEFSPEEKALRDLFVTEFLVDFDQIKAAQRCGFNWQFAVEYARKFMAEPYVQQRISQLQSLMPRNEEELLKYNKRRIQERLLFEAHYQGPGSSQAARVAALKALSDMYGMGSVAQARTAGANQAGLAGGVMVVPEIANVDDWESQAMQNQKDLRRDIIEDQQ